MSSEMLKTKGEIFDRRSSASSVVLELEPRSNIQRPKANETEEDLLRLQQEFEKSKIKPAVTIVKCKPRESESKSHDNPKKKKVMDDKKPLDDTLPTILFDVKERDCKSTFTNFNRPINQSGFPKVFHRNKTGNGEIEFMNTKVRMPASSKKKPSLFSQQMRKLHPQQSGVSSSCSSTAEIMETSKQSELFTTPHLISGEGLADYSGMQDVNVIHQENLHRLSQLTPEQLQEERNRIAESLDPTLLNFICNKSKPKCDNREESPQKSIISNQKIVNRASDLQEIGTQNDYPIAPDSSIPHFDKLEKDKLKWMKNIPDAKLKIDKNTSEARFDFHGRIIPPDQEIPSHLGLHHHGDDPERGGYTIEELFTLSRSAFPQQRKIAVATLSACIRQSQFYAAHVGQLAPPLVTLLPTMLDAGLALLSRWLLDDAVSNSVQGGCGSEQGDLHVAVVIDLLNALLCSSQDESLLNEFLSWRNNVGLMSVNLITKAYFDDRSESMNQKESERPILTDYEELQLDLVQGLVNKTQLLDRISYLFQVKIQLPADTVVQLIQILMRIARHSKQMAYQIVQCKLLLDSLVKNFLPKIWEPIDNKEGIIDNAYDRPSPDLMALLRILSQSSKSLALKLICDFDVMDRCLIYLAQDYRQVGLPLRISVELQLECLRALSVIVSYGIRITDFQNTQCNYIKLFHQVMKLWRQNEEDKHVVQLLLSWIQFFTLYLRSLNSSKSINSEALTLLSFLTGFVNDLMDEFANHFHEKKCNLRLLSSSIEFLCAYIDGRQLLSRESPESLISDCNNLISSHVNPLITSLAFENVFATYRSNATILSSDFKSKWEPLLLSPACHLNMGLQITLRCIVADDSEAAGTTAADDGGDVNPNVTCQWPCASGRESLCVLSSVVHLLHTLARVNKSFTTRRLLATSLTQRDLVSFLRAFEKLAAHPKWSNSDSQCTAWCTVFELDLVAQILLLTKYITLTDGKKESNHHVVPDFSLIHNVALRLLPLLITGQEDTAENLIKDVIFWPDFVFTSGDAESNCLSLTEASKLKFHQDLRSNLLPVSACYLNYMSHLITTSHQSHCDSFALIGCCLEDRLLPADWSFLPLISIYQSALESSYDDDKPVGFNSNQTDCPVIAVVHCLRWLTYLESCPSKLSPDSGSIATRLSRLLCAFLCSNELFFHEWGKFYLEQLLALLVQPMKLSRIQLDEKIPGVSGFYDIYIELILQYSGVSYGDSLFCNYLLLPCHQRHHVKYRRALWGEYQRALRLIIMPVHQLATSLQLFLEPEESSDELLNCYVHALLTESVTATRNPLPYIIAVHHVNSFLYRHSPEKLPLQKQYYRALSGHSDELSNHILYYRYSNLKEPMGLEMFENLPELRMKHLESLQS